jgi:hypothetical protein
MDLHAALPLTFLWLFSPIVINFLIVFGSQFARHRLRVSVSNPETNKLICGRELDDQLGPTRALSARVGRSHSMTGQQIFFFA